MGRDIGLRKVLMGAASTSTNTSDAVYVGDMQYLSISYSSQGSLGASRFTVQGSNADGLQTTDLGGATSNLHWSLVTGVNMVGVSPGILSLGTLGVRWLRAHVTPYASSVNSYTTLVLAGRAW